MIDSLYAAYSRRRQRSLDPKYKPEDAIKRKILLNEDSNKLAVIFPGWHTHNFPVNVLAKRLVRRGWAVLYYDFHDQLLEPDDKIVAKSFAFAQNSIAKELQEIVQTKKYDQIHFIGISMGNTILAMVTKRFAHFTSATLVLAGDDLAIDMWHGVRTSYLGEQFRKMHIGMRVLDKEWSALRPAAYASAFKNKDVKFVISLNDKFILTKYQNIMMKRLIESGAQIKIKKHRVGHVATILLYSFFDSPL